MPTCTTEHWPICPTCGSAEIAIVRECRSYPTVLAGQPGPPWTEAGEGRCRNCGARFSICEEVVEDDEAPTDLLA